MKIVVIGGTGLIGAKLVNKLNHIGHEVLAASPSTGVNTITGKGLAEVLKNANIVVDVANAPSFEDRAALEFFEASGHNLLAAERAAKVGHHIALSVVGADLLTDNGYFRAKIAQENLIKKSKVPYTIVRATQFFEFLGSMADSNTIGQTVHVPAVFLQPIAADDVAESLFKVVLEAPINGTIEIAGPERLYFPELIQQYLKAIKDPRSVVTDDDARYFGAKLNSNTLVPGKHHRLGSIDLKRWLHIQKKAA